MIKICRILLPAGCFIFSIVLLTNCAGIGKRLEPPRISLANIQVQEFTGFETVFQIKLRVFNTNDVGLDVKGIEADLAINGKPFATGVSKAGVQIPSFETRLVPVTVYSSVIDIFKSVQGLQKAEQLTYTLKGKLRVAADNAPAATLPFESEGQLTLTGSEELKK
ncbi:MAG: LEA type 2 family protein [Desulfobacterales bacterium]|nr:MAG: LEA type 2 family protein [Desulfobacterales bacterium]